MAEKEIEMLKKRIAELETISGDKAKPEIIKEAIKEHLGKIPEEVLPEGAKLPAEEIKRQAEKIIELKEESGGHHQEQIRELLQYAQQKGILNAVSVIKYVDDPHLEDDFHDALVRYFQNI